MALRIDTAIVRGEIDNTQRGQVKARLWLLDHSEPIELSLTGDAWMDVAGTFLTFENPEPLPQQTAVLAESTAAGSVGDITASRKVRVFTVPEEEWMEAFKEERINEVPTEWRNSLYMEWFTEEQGRCVVESADFIIAISEHHWQMDEAEEQAQIMANQQAMRDYLATMIQRSEPRKDESFDEMTEEDWERQLQESDRVTDAHMEAMEKYGEDEDADEKTAFVMGWDHMLDLMAGQQENGSVVDDEELEEDEDMDDLDAWKESIIVPGTDLPEDESLDEWLARREKAEPHPLQQFSQDFVIRIMKSLENVGLNDQRKLERDHPLERFVGNAMQISGKLAGALGFPMTEHDLDPAYVLAILKRCLNWANLALAALNELAASEGYTSAQRELFESFRGDLFKLREGITDLRRELRGA